jgi:hypothetical protein
MRAIREDCRYWIQAINAAMIEKPVDPLETEALIMPEVRINKHYTLHYTFYIRC